MGSQWTVDGYQMGEDLLQRIPTLINYPVKARAFERGQVLARVGEPMTELSIMVRGRAKVFRVMNNGRAVLYTLFQGLEVIGDLELLLGYPQATTDIVAISQGLLLTLSLSACKQQLLGDTAMLRLLGHELARKLERSSRMGAQNLLYPLQARFAAYLLFSAQKGVFCENLTHVSEQMAASYRHLLRVIRTLCDTGVLEHVGKSYRIRDEEKLREICGEILGEE